jgi:hypothetical protein
VDSVVLNKFLTEMTDMLKEAKDFSMEQLPLVVKEILIYNLTMNLVGVSIGALFIVVAGGLLIKIHKSIGHDKHALENWLGLYAIPAALTVVGCLITHAYLPTALQIYLAPRVYLLEYITTLLKHVSH